MNEMRTKFSFQRPFQAKSMPHPGVFQGLSRAVRPSYQGRKTTSELRSEGKLVKGFALGIPVVAIGAFIA